jgi:predicted dehydrogenase
MKIQMNNPIVTGITAFGMSGKLFQAPFIEANPNFELRAIVERHKNESRTQYPDSQLYRSVEDLLMVSDIELVIINTPPDTHYDYALQAIRAGKHMIVEKPFMNDAMQSEEIRRLANERGLLLTVYQNRRYDADYLAVKKVVQSKILGSIKEVEMRYDRYTPSTLQTNKESPVGGRASNLHDLGSHLIDQAIQLFGFPHAVFADLAVMGRGSAQNDYFEVLLYYPGPLRVRIKGTMFAKESPNAYILHGEHGTFIQQRSDQQFSQLESGRQPSIEPWIAKADKPDGFLNYIDNGKEIQKYTYSDTGNYMQLFEEVHAALRHNKTNPVPAEDAVLTMKVLDAALMSNMDQRIIKLN